MEEKKHPRIHFFCGYVCQKFSFDILNESHLKVNYKVLPVDLQIVNHYSTNTVLCPLLKVESDFCSEQRSPRILSEVITFVRRETDFFSARNRLSLSNKRLSPYEDIIIETFQCNSTLALQSSDDVSSGSSTLFRGALFIYLLFIPFL